MSSRLMTMKFMQRAAASTPPNTSQSQSPSLDTPPSKRQKRSNSPPATSTSSPDLQLIETALLKEEEKKRKALERLAEEAGETRWVLSTASGGSGRETLGLQVVQAGYSDIDQETRNNAMIGRKSFGKSKQTIEKHQVGVTDEVSSSDEVQIASDYDLGDCDYDDDPSDIRGPMQASKDESIKSPECKRWEQKQADKAQVTSSAEKRRKKKVKLNTLSSISGSSGKGDKPSRGLINRECYQCGETGHERKDCSQRVRSKTNDHR